jgi:hypothetical protein
MEISDSSEMSKTAGGKGLTGSLPSLLDPQEPPPSLSDFLCPLNHLTLHALFYDPLYNPSPSLPPASHLAERQVGRRDGGGNVKGVEHNLLKIN